MYVLHAVVVTGWDLKETKAVRAHAVRLGCPATPVVASQINTFYTFCVTTHGSGRGWPTAAQGDAARRGFIAWLRRQSGYRWAEVAYGDDYEEDDALLQHSNDEVQLAIKAREQ